MCLLPKCCYCCSCILGRMLGCWAGECCTGQKKIVYLGVTAVAAASAAGGWGVVRCPAAKCPGRQDRHCLFLALHTLLCTVHLVCTLGIGQERVNCLFASNILCNRKHNHRLHESVALFFLKVSQFFSDTSFYCKTIPPFIRTIFKGSAQSQILYMMKGFL